MCLRPKLGIKDIQQHQTEDKYIFIILQQSRSKSDPKVPFTLSVSDAKMTDFR